MSDSDDIQSTMAITIHDLWFTFSALPKDSYNAIDIQNNSNDGDKIIIDSISSNLSQLNDRELSEARYLQAINRGWIPKMEKQYDWALRGVDLCITRGELVLLVGPNGAGKSTLMQVIAGRRLVSTRMQHAAQHTAQIRTLGVNPFTDTPKGVVYIGMQWMNNPITSRSASIKSLLVPHFHGSNIDTVIETAFGKNNSEPSGFVLREHYPRILRLRTLLDLLQVNVNSDISKLSQGQRRRVQFLLELLPDWECLLIDETAMELDIAIRVKLFGYLRDQVASSVALNSAYTKISKVDSKSYQNVPKVKTVIYTSHFLDNFILQTWCTNLILLADGKVFWKGVIPRESNVDEEKRIDMSLPDLIECTDSSQHSRFKLEEEITTLLQKQHLEHEKGDINVVDDWQAGNNVDGNDPYAESRIISAIKEVETTVLQNHNKEEIEIGHELWENSIKPRYYLRRGTLETLAIQRVLTKFLIQQERLMAKQQSTLKQPMSLWEYLKEDVYHYGDKYYNYWT